MDEFSVEISSQAKLDIINIYNYLISNLDNETFSRKIIIGLQSEIDKLSYRYGIGHLILDARLPEAPERRVRNYKKYAILYKVNYDKQIITVQRIVHSSRDYRKFTE